MTAAMMKVQSLRVRMMLLFTTVVGVLLALSYLAFFGLLVHEIPKQLNRQLLETGRPLVSDIVTEPDAQDINRLDIPGEFFELLDSSGNVLQRSANLGAPIDLTGISVKNSHPTFGTAVLGSAQPRLCATEDSCSKRGMRVLDADSSQVDGRTEVCRSLQ